MNHMVFVPSLSNSLRSRGVLTSPAKTSGEISWGDHLPFVYGRPRRRCSRRRNVPDPAILGAHLGVTGQVGSMNPNSFRVRVRGAIVSLVVRLELVESFQVDKLSEAFLGATSS